ISGWMNCAPSGPRVMARMQLPQPFSRHMSVYLRGGNIGVSQQKLHHAQVGAVIQKMRCKGMAQHMRREWGVYGSLERIAAHQLPKGLTRHGGTSCSDEQGVAAVDAEQGAAALAQVTFDPMLGFGAHGYESVFAALAHDHAHDAIGKIYVEYAQTHQLADSQSGGIERFKHGPIAQAPR